MTIEINDHVLVSLSEKVLGAITHHNDAARRADSDRDNAFNTQDIIGKILDAIPQFADLIKAVTAPAPKDQPTDTPKPSKCEFKLAQATPVNRIFLALRMLSEFINEDQIKQISEWVKANADDPDDKPDVPSVDPSLNDGKTDGGNPDGDKPHEE